MTCKYKEKLLGEKIRLLTGIKATGVHIGNWVGAIEPALTLSATNEYESFLFIADYHALNTVQKPEDLKQITYEVAATWLAMGLDPAQVCFYKQSDIAEIFELSVILSTLCPKGLLNRAHAYKAKRDLNQTEGVKDLDVGVNMGLFTYPLLMTADILAFNAELIPVGKDNLQHLEIARDMAGKFNRTFEEKFKLPEALIQENPELLPGLDGRKMSASYNNHIPCFLSEKKLRKTIMKITTDSTPPDVPKEYKGNTLYQIYKAFATKAEVQAYEKSFSEGIAWGVAKEQLFELLNEKLVEPRKIYDHYMSDLKLIDGVLAAGAEKAREVSSGQLEKVKKAIGVKS